MKRRLSLAAILVVVGAIAFHERLEALVICENLYTNTVSVGEMRYHTTSGTDDCYANAYWDGGDELSLASTWQPGALTGTNYAYFRAAAIHQDVHGSDCSNVLFTMRLRDTSACSGGFLYSTTTALLRINSCDPPGGCSGNDCDTHSEKAMTLSHQKSSGMEVFLDVDTSSGCNISDTGCLVTTDAICDTLVNF